MIFVLTANPFKSSAGITMNTLGTFTSHQIFLNIVTKNEQLFTDGSSI